MRSRSAIIASAAVASSLLVVGCLIKERQETTIVKHEGVPDGTYIVGGFQGTFSIAKARVRAKVRGKEYQTPTEPTVDEKIGPTDLVVTKVDSNGEAEWIRSFSSLSPGRAVLHWRAGSQGVLVVGIFTGEIAFDGPDQVLRAPSKDGVFVVVVSPKGHVSLATVAATGGHLASPDISRDNGGIVVTVPFEKGATLLGTRLAVDKGKLRFSIGEKVELKPLEPIKAALNGSTDQKGGLRLASMLQAPSCNVCRVGVPQEDPDCEGCRDKLVNVDGWCVDTGWDRLCMDEAVWYCAGKSVCTCPHRTCSPGDYLHPQCTGGSADDLCVGVIDSYLPSCGYNHWDDDCVRLNRTCPHCSGC